MTKIEDATNEQLNITVAEKVMELDLGRCPGSDMTDRIADYDCAIEEIDACDWRCNICGATGYIGRRSFTTDVSHDRKCPDYSTNIVHAFQVDKPEWKWRTTEGDGTLYVRIWTTGEDAHMIGRAQIPLDPNNKVAAHCRGRCIVALLVCGVKEI